MKRLLGILVLSLASALPSLTQPQSTKASCSPIISGGTNNHYTFSCDGLTPAEGKQLLQIVNQIAKDRLDPAMVMKALDEIKALAAKGSTSPEAVAEGVQRGLTSFQEQQQQRFQDAQNNPKTIAESSYTLLSKYLGMLQMYTPQPAGPSPDSQLLPAYHAQFDILVGDNIQKLQSRNVPIGDLARLSKNINSHADIERLENAFKEINDSSAHFIYLRLATFLSRVDRVTTNPSPSQFPIGQAIQLYRGSYASTISENLAKLQSQHIVVDDLIQIQNNLNSLDDIQRLANGFKKLADSLK